METNQALLSAMKSVPVSAIPTVLATVGEYIDHPDFEELEGPLETAMELALGELGYMTT